MQKKKETTQIKQIILYVLLAILVLLIIFAEDIMKLANKNKIGLLENNPNEAILVEPNIPQLSAGMIPVKANGTNWIITTSIDKEWYNYANGQPAYIMLNNGTYQSELVQKMEENGQKLAEENVNIPIQPDELGTIFVWIPSFAYNEEGEIKYIKNIGITEENWTIPDIFSDKHEETAPDFLLTGIWIEKDLDEDFENQIAQMNQEESIYGFIKNTLAIPSDQQTQDAIQKYIEQTYENKQNPIGDISNSNRIILRTIRQNNQTPLKATGLYNEETERVEINITYTQFGINKVLCDNKEIEFQIQKQNRTAVVTIEGKFIEKGKHTITIIDNENNKKDIEIYKSVIYAFLYKDGTLELGISEKQNPNKIVEKEYGEISDIEDVAWYNERENILAVDFKDTIYPKTIKMWFTGCKNLGTINNINNLNTVKVTDMRFMFSGCSSLTSLDLSKFNTSNVTNMTFMFNGCSSLTSLDLSNFNTSNVTNMTFMFSGCSSLTSLDLSNFNTSNVTSVSYMFSGCSSLTNLNLSNINTTNITDMSGMFNGCSSLTSLNLINFNTTNVTTMTYMFERCSSLTSLNLTNFNTSNVTNMNRMFSDCTRLISVVLTGFNTTNTTTMGGMFSNCSSLTRLDLSSFNTSNVTDMDWMFYNCKKLRTIGVSSKDWITTNATKEYMFYNCGTSSVTNFK